MDHRRLRYFMQIAAEGSLGRASRSLGIAQPALGRQIQLLEAELGVALFERVAKGMRLTEEGEYLRDALDHPLRQVDMALRNVRTHATRAEAALTLGLPATLAQFLGPRLVARMRRDLPGIKLRVVEDGSAKLAVDLARGLVDMALLVGVTPDDKVFRAEVLSERLMLVGPPGSALAARPTVRFEELADYPLILPGTRAGLPTLLEKLAARMDSRLAIACEIDSTELAKRSVEAGLGYAILPPRAFRDEAARGDLVGAAIVDPDITESVLFAVQPHWRVRRSTYDEVERVIFGELIAAVDGGAWEATWLLDRDRLSSGPQHDAGHVEPGVRSRSTAG